MGINEFSEIDRNRLKSLAAAMIELEALGLPHLVCLFTVALEPGLSINELAERTGVPQQSVSRYVATLLGRYQSDLVPTSFEPLLEQQINADDPRKRALWITPAGRVLIERFCSDPPREFREDKENHAHVGG